MDNVSLLLFVVTTDYVWFLFLLLYSLYHCRMCINYHLPFISPLFFFLATKKCIIVGYTTILKLSSVLFTTFFFSLFHLAQSHFNRESFARRKSKQIPNSKKLLILNFVLIWIHTLLFCLILLNRIFIFIVLMLFFPWFISV